MTISELRKKIDTMKGQRSTHWAKALELKEKSRTEKRSLTPEEQVAYREFIAKMDQMAAEITDDESELRTLIEMEGKGGIEIVPQVGGSEARGIASTPEYRSAFYEFVSGNKTDNEVRAMAKTGGAGVLVPTSLETKFYKYLNDYSVMRRLSTVITLGTDKTYIMMEDTGIAGWIDEGGSYGQTDDTFSKKNVGAYKVGRIAKLSKELLQDSIENLEDYVAKSLARAIARAENTAFTKGNASGTAKTPRGFVHDATKLISASSSALVLDEVKKLQFKVHPDSRKVGKYMCNTQTASDLSIIKDTTGNYIWQPSNIEGQPDKLFGKPVEINEDMDDVGSEKFYMAFGNFEDYQITDRQGFTTQRLGELYAETGNVGFLADRRTDGILMFAKGVAVIQCKA